MYNYSMWAFVKLAQSIIARNFEIYKSFGVAVIKWTRRWIVPQRLFYRCCRLSVRFLSQTPESITNSDVEYLPDHTSLL